MDTTIQNVKIMQETTPPSFIGNQLYVPQLSYNSSMYIKLHLICYIHRNGTYKQGMQIGSL